MGKDKIPLVCVSIHCESKIEKQDLQSGEVLPVFHNQNKTK